MRELLSIVLYLSDTAWSGVETTTCIWALFPEDGSNAIGFSAALKPRRRRRSRRRTPPHPGEQQRLHFVFILEFAVTVATRKKATKTTLKV